MAERMPKEGRDKILQVLDRVSDLVEGGQAPNEALAKAASEHRLPPGHVRLAAQAFNTGRANFHRKTASSVLEKAAPVALADAEGVIARLYPETVKSAALYERMTSISDDYLLPPSQEVCYPSFLSTGMEKAAEVTFETAGPLPKEDTRTVKRAFATLRDYDRLVEEKKMEADGAHLKAESAYKMASLALRVAPSGWQEVKDNVCAFYGKKGEVLCRHLEEDNRVLVKAAQAPRSFSAFDKNRAPYREIAACLTALEGYQQAKKACEALANDETANKAEKLLRPMNKVADEKGDKGGKGQSFSLAGAGRSGLGGLLSGLQYAGKNIAAPMGQFASQQRSFQGKDDKALEALTSPDHELQMRQIRMKAMLHDLMANDPVLSEHDPQAVIEAFNEVQRLAPRAMDEPAVARALLRKHLAQGGVDTHELKQVGEVELGLRRSRELPALAAPDAAKPVAGTGRGYGNKTMPKATILKSMLGGGGE